MMLWYAVRLERDTNETILVSFRDFPEAHTFGEDEKEALAQAVEPLGKTRKTELPSAAVNPCF